ncbi:uncharacterized protein J7T54_004984 [Emericellopsis cladophorae]|uniref:HECT-type E3 ubiquitin transferase n=1 Tax=Emericellopsis cladophorae TaxID=2686198 RepID=A0A9P9Y285_9HYPO|nr:uncharacterized protein J7T54_004984 [Emericellopsis cladophorae]KAI6781818.1 hypothetical protein J7T54_004984 [Emericellopsis cladophorae]
MGKITKAMTAKHRETLSPWLKAYVDEACTTPLPLLPNKLAEFPSRWSFGRGDLYHWIPLLNRFDSILERFCSLYELGKGPQIRDFTSELITAHSGDPDLGGKHDWQQNVPEDFRIHDDADKLLVESVLGFSTMLLKQCGNRSVYASSSHLNDLLNSSSWDVLIATLEVAFELAKRYQASVRRLSNPSRQWNAALLANHYNIDLDRVQQLAAPFMKSKLVGLGEPVTTSTPGSSSKGKDKASAAGTRSAHNGVHHNDLVSLACSQNDRWTGWGDIQTKYFPEEQLVQPQIPPHAEASQSPSPVTPTPLRRTQTMNTQSQSTPRPRPGQAEQSSPLGPSTPFNHEDAAGSSQKVFELPHSVVSSVTIPELLSRLPSDMPSATKYEVFHRLRVAKAILSTPETRQRALAVRFLAITNLAYIHNEATFIEKVFRQDGEETRRFQLIYQLAELIRPSADGTSVVPLWLQTISMVLLEVLAYFSTKTQDVLSAVNANVNHGVLLYVIRKAAAGLREDDGTEAIGKVTTLDQWRKSLFDMAMYLCVQSRSQEMVSSGLVEVLVEMLNFRSKTVQRYYPTIIGFLESILWYPVNAFNPFLNINGLDAVASLIVDTVQQAHDHVRSGHGISDEHKSSLIDYKISYYQQQSLRALLRLIHHAMTNSPTVGGNTDRLLRNLVDKSDLLASLRCVISEKEMFGAIDWTYSVTILSDFINNDPTSFSVLMEAGLIKTFLAAVTGDTAAVEATAAAVHAEATTARAEDGDSEEVVDNDEPTPAGSAILADLEDDGRPHPPPEDVLSMDRGALAKGILPYSDAINVVPQVLNSISLNNAGMKMVVSSHAFDHFFQIFENPDHVKGMMKAMEPDQDPNKEIASNVGQSFDELARHHPALRTSITNALIDLVARIRYLGLKKARTDGWGVKLRVTSSDGSHLAVTTDGALRSASIVGDQPTSSTSSARAGDAVMAESSEALEKDSTDTSSSSTSDETVYNCFTPYVQALSTFLTSCFSNHGLKSGFVARGGTELLLDICESPCHSSSFGESQTSRELGHVISRLVEVSPIRTLPSILNRTQQAVDELRPLVSQTDVSAPYLAPFLKAGMTVSQQPGDLSEVLRGGSKMVHALLNVQNLIRLLSQCFHSSRSHTLTLYPVNVYDHYLGLIKSIGSLIPAILTEEAAQASLVPQKWSGRRTLGAIVPDETVEDVEPTQAAGEPEDQAQADSNATSGDPARASDTTDNANSSNPRYHNYEVLYKLIHPLPPTIYPFFQALGQSLLPRREPSPTPGNDAYTRARQIELAKALADALLDHLRTSVDKTEHSSSDFHYWIIMFLSIQEMLIENNGPGRHSETRSNCQISMPVFFAFKERGGFDVLNNILRVLSTCVQSSGAPPEPQAKFKVAGLALKKILDLYYILGNGKYISEGANTCNLQRHTDKNATVPNIFEQFTVEVRTAMLPALTHLWTSSVVEKIPDQTAKRLIDVLKLISRGEHEPQSTPTDKAPFILTDCKDTRFRWYNVRATLRDLQRNEAWSDIAHEATYRANGHIGPASEYCTGHLAGIIGPRNPIPPQDQEMHSPQESAANRPSRTSSHDTELSDGDRMSLDDPDSDELREELGSGFIQSFHDAVNAGPSAAQETSNLPFPATKDGLDKLRIEFRKDLIERCLDVIRTHPSTAMEVADLINATIMRQDDKEELEDVCSTLTFALSSLAMDEEEKKRNGQCISSYAHLLGLLLQNKAFFQSNLDILRDKVEEYVDLLKVPSPNTAENLPPWIPHILLVLEMLLREDERPVAAQWKPPQSIEDPIEEPVLTLPTPLVEQDNRDQLLESVLSLLPRVGKEDVLATSVLRILVILTRKRALAKRVGDKRNLQRLFLMAKQLAGSGAGRLKQDRTTAHIMMILRHIVEDEEVIKQIMRTEIRAEFSHITRARHSHADVPAYLRHMAALAPRSPDIFVEVTNELVQFERWSPATADRSSTLVLKEPTASNPDAPLTEEANVKPSTEQSDKEMSDVAKPPTELKRPLVENPDGVVHFLLSELVNYREVDDKEPTAPVVESASKSGEAESTQTKEEPPADGDASPSATKDKKPLKPVFKAEEHPIFVYRCFLLSCLAELLHSYTRTKVEFINFKRSAPPLTSNTPIKPRTSVLNYLIYDLLCQGNLNGTTDTIASKKKAATSAQTLKLLVALVTKTSEKPIDRGIPKYEYDDEPDLLFVRKFVLDTISKAYERAPVSDDPLETRYSRMQSLAELMYNMITERDRDPHLSRPEPANGRSQAQLRRLMFEKGFLDKLTSSIAEVNVNFPGVKRAIKYILRVLRILTDTAKDLSHANLLPANPGAETVEDDIISTSSLSDLDDDREETPDLYRNSSLGMLEPGGDDDDESEDGDEDGEDLYGDEYDDEMDYDEDAMSEDDQDNVSEDSEMGEIEGMPGNPDVVEVIMDGDDDDDDEDEEDDSDEDDDDDEDEDLDSADMEDVEDRVEIINEDGEPIDDDGNTDWESDREDDDDMDEEVLQFEPNGRDGPGNHEHLGVPGGLIGNMARALLEGEEYDPDMMDPAFDDDDDAEDLDDLEEEEDQDEMEELEDEEDMMLEENMPLNDDPMMPEGHFHWDMADRDGEPGERMVLIGEPAHRHRAMARGDPTRGFPPGFVVGGHGGRHGTATGGAFRSFFSRRPQHAPPAASATDDSINPLLRRQEPASQDNRPQTSGHSRRPLEIMPEGVNIGGGRRGINDPMGILGELLDFLPHGARDGHHFQLQIAGPGGVVPHGRSRDMIQESLFRDLMGMGRGHGHESRRDTGGQEPHQAVAFQLQSTMERYTEEAAMLFMDKVAQEAAKLANIITAKLIPAAVARELKLKAEETKRIEKEEAERQERERKLREEKEQADREAKEKAEAEAKEAAERAASQAAAVATSEPSTVTGENTESGAMEGVESTSTTITEGEPTAQSTTASGDTSAGVEPTSDARASTPDQQRVVTVLNNQEVDVTDLGIDPDYLAALPEEYRQEVIAQTISERRTQAREQAPTGQDPGIFQEFLDALPTSLRRDIEAQEAHDRRRRRNESGRNAAAAPSAGVEINQGNAGGAAQPPGDVFGEMDAADILLTFPAELREQVLAEQGHELIAHLPPEMAAQARRLQQDAAPPPRAQVTHRRALGAGGLSPPPPPEATGSRAIKPQQRRTVVQMLDKYGVATLVRLMFIAQQGSIRNHLFGVFADVCENRQNRLEVVSTLLQILQEGSTDMHAVDRSFSQLSLKARRAKDEEIKTPRGLKRTSTSILQGTQTSSETSPLLIVQQCLDLLVELCSKNPHVPWLFLTEHETVGFTLKRALGRKGKGKDKDSRVHKFAINSLLTLLDRTLVMDNAAVMAHLADLLNRVTMPLQALERRRREAEEKASKAKEDEAKESEKPSESTSAEPSAAAETAAHDQPAGAAATDATAEQPDAQDQGDQSKKSRLLQPPLIPDQYLVMVVKIFVARECSSKTFQNTIATIKNLSTLEGAKSVFGNELVAQAELLSKNIVSDLDNLLPHIEKAKTGTEIQGVALANFSPGNSEQNKLLRVLTALDHLFDVKKRGEGSTAADDQKSALLSSLYHNSTFSAMWEKLGACLSAIHQRENMLHVATILLPLIESLMVVCKNTAASNTNLQEADKDMLMASPPPESRTASLFFTFTEEHRRILNELVRSNPKLMSGTFALLVKNPKVLEFDNKRNYFNRSVHSRTGQPQHGRPSYPTLNLQVRRNQVFHDSFRSLYFKSGDEMKFGKLNIRFHGEEGVDAGGVTREWFQVLARQMFDPNYVLFIPVSSDRTTFHPNKLSGVNEEHLMFFKFIGRIIGKALYEGRVLDCFFSRAVYKRILGKSVSVKDMESFDPDYYKSLCWMLENDITDIITETFSVEDDEFGVTNVVDLKPGGRDIPVTDENKQEYVKLVVEHKLLSSVKDQMEHFLKGFHDIIPSELISIFNEQELELLISGLPDIDIDDWKSTTEYHNYTPSSPQIQWFWRAVRSFDKEERAKLLQFVTGTSKVPLNGFRELEGMNGIQRFNIHRAYGNNERLPTSHTCFNQLDLPEFESYDALRSQLFKAITQGSEYFGFA